MGPGLVTGASDDDPSGIATYAQAGASFSLGMLWAAPVGLPLMSAVQEICDRTALATGRGLGELIVRRFSRGWSKVIAVLLVALIVANGLNIAADLVAVGAGMHLLHAGPTALWALISGVALTVLLIAGSFAGDRPGVQSRLRHAARLCRCARYGECLLALSSQPQHRSAHSTLQGLHRAPGSRVRHDDLAVLVLLADPAPGPGDARGTPGRQPACAADPAGSASRRPQARNQPRQRADRHDLLDGGDVRHHRGVRGHPTISSAAQAAEALRPIAGHAATVIFALGFIESGTLAIPVLAGAGSAGMAGLLGKASGFSTHRARRQCSTAWSQQAPSEGPY